MINRLALACVLGLAVAAPAAAQDRIAYANLDTILQLMPEARTAAAGVDSMGRQLSMDLQVKEAYHQKKLEEARKAQASGAPDATLEKFRTDLRDLETEIRNDAEAADQKLAEHRAALSGTVLDKLQEHIKAVAKAEGYQFVLSSVDGQGNSIVLYGQEDHDITKKILTHMGIAIPPSGAGKGGAPADKAAPKSDKKSDKAGKSGK